MDQTDEDPDLSVKMCDESNLSYSDHSFDKDGEISSDFSEDGNRSPSLRTVPASTKSMNVPQSSSGASHLISLFPQSAPAPASDGAKRILTDGEVPPKPFQRPTHHRQNTERISNSGTKRDARSISDKEDYYNESKDEMSNLLTSNDESKKNYYGTRSAVPKKLSIDSSFFAPISSHSQDEKKEEVRIVKESYFSKFEISWASIIPTIAGSAVSALFHIVFCLAQASAIHRPYSLIPVMGVCVRMAAVGPLVAGVMFIYNLGEGFAAVCPTLDIFPAPFFAQMAAVVDRCLVEAGLEEDDLMFLTTFGLLTTISLVLTGMLIIIGTKVKLANLGAFLPFPVMCGFFSSVGVLLWNLSFTIDTGESVWKVLSGGDREKMRYCMVHHLGSLLAGTFTFIVSKKYKKLMPLLAIMPIPIVYLGMAFTGTTLQDAQKHGWFWSEDDITVRVSWSNVDAIKWEPPMPFGVILGTYQGKVHFPALLEGLPIAISMALIFFIRCSLHAPALRKTSNNLLKWSDEEDKNDERQISSQFEGSGGEEDWFVEDVCDLSDSNRKSTRALNSMNLSISDTFLIYGKILSVNGLAGGFACLPSVGSGVTLYKIGASGAFAQYGSLFLLAIFYLTQFTIVGFLPKMTFSALLFVTSIEMIETWFLSSYRKTIVKSEWVVTPIIVVATFLVGSLQSVALGLAISTFLVVGTLNRSGVVKFISNGLTVKSITERNAEDAAWLDQNGDLIQLLVLQSYIFFGNANSCLSYVNSMFDDPAEAIMKNLQFPLPPLPKYVIIDMTLVVGMDTSSVEVFGEIIQLCHKNMCRVFLTGCHKSLKEILSLGGVKPSTDSKSANSILSFPSDIESALCKAEDYLLKNVSHLEEKERRVSRIRKNSSACDGFQYALMKIDEQVSA